MMEKAGLKGNFLILSSYYILYTIVCSMNDMKGGKQGEK